MSDYISQIPVVFFLKQLGQFVLFIKKYFPAAKILGDLINKDSSVNFFITDPKLINNTSQNPTMYSTYRDLMYLHPNILEVWPEVEGRTVVKFFNLLGQFYKNENIFVHDMGREPDKWDGNIVVFGAQAGKCIDFYRLMKNVGYLVKEDGLYNNETGEKILDPRDDRGYGLIIKATNPSESDRKHAFLIGGFGILGTQASMEYFFKNINSLGKEFGEQDFSIIVEKMIDSPEGVVDRLKNFDKRYR